jgi:hypothetical protein
MLNNSLLEILLTLKKPDTCTLQKVLIYLLFDFKLLFLAAIQSDIPNKRTEKIKFQLTPIIKYIPRFYKNT